ncbi:MAG: type II secretion system protein [Candidatus Omnitrophica bacterium]|nr:type II secretion system protein [Candidatus Omnitrophota bacterium]
MKEKRLGFTLIEIMVVVGLILILLTIAVPNYLRSRLVAIENMAVSNILTIHNACQLYHINNETYPDSLSDLTTPNSNPPYLDNVLASGEKQGYQFLYTSVDDNHFTLRAEPASTGLLTARFFYLDEVGVVHARGGSSAGSDDPIFR